MANNFKILGNRYVSIDGSDSNAGNTPDLPKRTLQAALNVTAQQDVIISTGVYREAIYKNMGNSNLQLRIFGDGHVIMEGNGTNAFEIEQGGYSAAPVASYFYDLIFRNYLQVLTDGGSAYNQGTRIFSRCTFYCNVQNYGINTNGASYSACKFIGCNLTTNVDTTTLNSCILINFTNSLTTTENKFITTLTNCYVSPSSRVKILNNSGVSNCNFQGIGIVSVASTATEGVIQDVNGRYYDLSIASGGSGTLIDPYGRAETANSGFYLDALKVAYSTFATSFSLDPKFNDMEAGDFTLQADSPHIGAGVAGANIGGTNYAIRDSADGDVYNTSAVSVTNLVINGDDYVISGGTTGEVVGAPRLLSSPSPTVIQRIRYNGLLDFRKAVTPPASGNRNVPDQETYASTTQPPDVAGANPDRLVYYMRFSTQSAQPTIDAEWDNNGLWTAGNYETFEWDTKPSIDTTPVGNGNPAFNINDTPVYITATWIQIKVKLRNDYV